MKVINNLKWILAFSIGLGAFANQSFAISDDILTSIHFDDEVLTSKLISLLENAYDSSKNNDLVKKANYGAAEIGIDITNNDKSKNLQLKCWTYSNGDKRCGFILNKK